MSELKLDWKNWKIGSKIIFTSFFGALFSMFLSWSYGSFFPQNGFTQLTVIFLLFWIYPLTAILVGKKINRNLGLGCSLAPFIATLCYIYSKNAEIFGSFMNLAGIGAWTFLFASIALGVGVYQHAIEFKRQFDETPNLPSSNSAP